VRRQISATNFESKADPLKKWIKGWKITSQSVAGLKKIQSLKAMEFQE